MALVESVAFPRRIRQWWGRASGRHKAGLVMASVAAFATASCASGNVGSTSTGGEYQHETTPHYAETPQYDDTPLSCSQLLRSVISDVRNEETGPEVSRRVQGLADNCASDYDTFSAYMSGGAMAEAGAWLKCDDPHQNAAAMQLLRVEGLCNEGVYWPEDGIGWDEAHTHIGEWQRICGSKRSIRGTDNGVFVNLGYDYPSQDRFSIVLWGDWWLDDIPYDTTVCAEGPIHSYEGVPMMELQEPEDLEIWR